jgi:uncharacterized lipoprotein YmbA
MRSVWRVGSVAVVLLLAGCGGGAPSDADVVASVRAVLAGAMAQAPTSQSPDTLPAAARQQVMAIDVGVGDIHANGDGSFDAMVKLTCQAANGTVSFTQGFDMLRAQQGWSLSAIGGKALAKLAAPCLTAQS